MLPFITNLIQDILTLSTLENKSNLGNISTSHIHSAQIYGALRYILLEGS